jgi:uncharacterized protein YcaQ
MAGADLSRQEARWIALAAQGFHRPRPRRVTTRHIAGAIRRLGLLQLDFVNVLIPAHYVVPFSRLGPYDRRLFEDVAYRSRAFTEQWAHEASIIPVETWPLLRHRMETHRVRPWGFEKFLAQNAAYVAMVVEAVRRRGPLCADDLPEPEGAPRRMSDWWGWGLAVRRQVFEAHFGFGRLATVGRKSNFARVYDLAERVIPRRHFARQVRPEDAERELLRQAARACGIAAAGDLADYFRMRMSAARPRIAELVESGELREVRVEGWRERAYLYREAPAPKPVDAAALLSPFDPLIWYRDRVARLFQFDFRLEIFVPAEKRKWGYYVLPFLLGDRLVARVDLKADRAARRLLVQAAYLERGAPRQTAQTLRAEIQTMAQWLGLDSLAIGQRGDLARQLRGAEL